MTEEQKEFIRDNSKDIHISKIARQLKISYCVVYKFIRKNNLPQKKVQVRKEGKVIESEFFNVNKMQNWAI